MFLILSRIKAQLSDDLRAARKTDHLSGEFNDRLKRNIQRYISLIIYMWIIRKKSSENKKRELMLSFLFHTLLINVLQLYFHLLF